eukprot:jgi/Pico_ML_1/51737/g302.t1
MRGREAHRVRTLERVRQQQRALYESRAREAEEAAGQQALREFGAGRADALEAAFKEETTGLVTREEFSQRRATLEKRVLVEEERRKRELEEEEERKAEERRKKRAKLQAKATLSFADEGADEDEACSDEGARAGAKGGGKLVAKDPLADTDFLPDKERERKEEELRAKLKEEWLQEQERIKEEPLEVTYSYWDGSGHRRKAEIKKGDTIGDFLKVVRKQLAPEFRELRTTDTSGMMYIKEDLIIPQHYTFYELIASKARGKSGPLFHFDVRDDVRLLNDATVEKEEAHAGKVVEKHWYERNKHIFPASRWETYDPTKSFDKYTIHGD